MSRSPHLCALVVLAAGCSLEAFERATEYQDMFPEGTGTGTSSAEVGGGDGGDGGSSPVATVTGDESAGSTDPSSSSAPPTSGPTSWTSDTDEPAGPPQILGCTATPASVEQPGEVELALKVAGEVEEVELELDGQHVVTLGAGERSHVWEVLSDDDNGEPRAWTATARGPGGEASCDIAVVVQLPPGGQPTWTKQLVPDGEFSFGHRVAVGLHGEAFVTGYRYADGQPRMFVRRYVGGEETWTWTPADWSQKPDVASAASAGADIKVLADGDLVVAGNLNDLGQRYVARLRPDAPPAARAVWESTGNVGELAVGLAVDDQGNVALAGDAPHLTEDTTQLAVWGWNADGLKPWLKFWTTAKMGRDEHGTGVAFARNRLIAVGQAASGAEADVTDQQRAVVLTMTGSGLLVSEWTSLGEFGPDAALDVETVGDEFCFTGWTGVPRRALTRCSADLVPSVAFADATPGVGLDISHNRVGEPIVVGQRATEGQAAFVQAFRSDLGSQHWMTVLGSGGSRASGVACDEWGSCVWTGHALDAGSWQCVTGGLTP